MTSTVSFSSEDSLPSLLEDETTSSYVTLKSGQTIKGQGNSTYKIISLLGDGASKCVYLAKNVTGKCVAINCTTYREVSSENTLLKRLRKLQRCTYVLLPTLFSKGSLEEKPLFFQIARAYDSDLFTLNEAIKQALDPNKLKHEYTIFYKDHTLCHKLPLFQKMLTRNIFQIGSAFFSAKGILRHLRKYELEHVDLHSGNIFINVHKKKLTITKLVLADWDFAQTAPSHLSCDAIKMARILDEIPALVPHCPLRAQMFIRPDDSVSRIYKVFQAALNAMDQTTLTFLHQPVSVRA